MASSRKAEGREVEEEAEKKKKVKYRKVKWWKTCEELIMSLSLMGRKRGTKEKESKNGERRPKARPALVKFGKWLFLFLIVGQNWLSVSAAAEGPQRRTDENAAGSASEGTQKGGGDFTKVEAAKSGRQN